MQKNRIFFVVGCLISLPLFAFAGVVRVDENYSLRKGEVVSEDLYAIGSNTTLAGNVFGDLVATGLSLFVGGNEVENDALLFANTAHVVSNIKGDLRGLVRQMYLGGSVGEDVAIVSQNFEIIPETLVKGSVSVVALDISIRGKIEGNLSAVAGEIYIDDVIKGNVTVRADRITLGPHARIEGNLTYSASLPVDMENGSQVIGEVSYSQIKTRTEAEKLIPSLWGTWLFIKFVVLLLSALVFHGLLRNISRRFVSVSMGYPFGSLMRGFLVFVAVPIASFIGFLTFIAIPFSLLALALFTIGILVAMVYAPIIFGSFITVLFHRQKLQDHQVTWRSILVGVIAITFLDLIPIAGEPLSYILLLIALGGIYQVLFDKFVEVR